MAGFGHPAESTSEQSWLHICVRMREAQFETCRTMRHYKTSFIFYKTSIFIDRPYSSSLGEMPPLIRLRPDYPTGQATEQAGESAQDTGGSSGQDVTSPDDKTAEEMLDEMLRAAPSSTTSAAADSFRAQLPIRNLRP